MIGAVAKLLVSHTHDAAVIAARIHAHLAARHGDDGIYLDVADIPAGEGGPGTAGRVAEVDGIVAVIDRSWMDGEEPNEGVVAELAPALRRGQPVVPVLVDGAEMPAAADLPPSLHSLAARPAVAVWTAAFDESAARVDAELARLGLGGRIASVPAVAPAGRQARALVVGAAIALLVLGALVFFMLAGAETNGWAPAGL